MAYDVAKEGEGSSALFYEEFPPQCEGASFHFISKRFYLGGYWLCRQTRESAAACMVHKGWEALLLYLSLLSWLKET